jgi:hypothetical protein
MCPSLTLEGKCFQIDGEALGAIQNILNSVSENLLHLVASKATRPAKPKLELVPKPEPVKATEPAEPEPAEPTKARRGRKPKDPAERKPRKSRKGESGSFPNSAIKMYEEMSPTFRHPMYEGRDNQTLDLWFARDYADAIMKCDSGLPFCNAFAKMSNTFMQLQDSGYGLHIHKARLKADSQGARYKDYLTAIFAAYLDIWDRYSGKGKGEDPPKYPQPQQLYGPKAQQYYEGWMSNQVDIPYEREVEHPELWPENYEGKDYQINYYTKMMEAVRRLCNSRGATPKIIIEDCIFRRIMSREFAEDPDLNRFLPGYKYALAA